MNSKDYISTIEPKKKWLDVDIKGLWHYRDLYYMNIKRDIVTLDIHVIEISIT